jgi:transposase
MQLQLPIFPKSTKMLTPTIGTFEEDGFVYYLHNGVPINVHHKDDTKNFRYITSKFVVLGLCRQVDIIKCFGVSESSVIQNVKKYREKGEDGFFGEDYRRGKCHKMLPDRIERIQKMIDSGLSNNRIAKKEKISEGTIRYAIQQGYLKKSPNRSIKITNRQPIGQKEV